MDLQIYDWNYLHGLRMMTLHEEDKKDVVELLPLTQDSLEMLHIRNGESGQKGGRKEEG